MDILGSIAIALLLLMGRDAINKHLFTAGTFLAFIVAVFKLYDPVRKFAMFNNNFQQAVGASSEIFRFMDVEDEVREKPGAKRMGKFTRAIRFANVSFSYSSENAGESPLVLHDINLNVKAGECWRWWDRAARAEHAGAFDSAVLRRQRRADSD